VITVSGRDTMAVTIISTFLAFLYATILYKINQKSQGKSIIRTAILISPLLGTILGTILGFFFIVMSYVYLYDFLNFMRIQYPKTPSIVFSILLILICLYTVKSGIEVTARVVSLLIIPVLLFIFFGIFFNFYDINFTPLYMPVESWNKVEKGILVHLPKLFELIALIILIPSLINKKRYSSSILVSLALYSIITISLIYTLYGNFGEQTPRLNYKLFMLFREMPRAESIFIIVWVSTFFAKISLFLYAASKCLGEVVNTKKWNVVVFPISVMIVAFSIVSFANNIEYYSFFNTALPLFELTIEIIIPSLLFVILIKAKSSENPARTP